MATLFDLAFAVRTASRSTQHPISLGHAQQLAAAAFGYGSLAAFQASALEPPTLDDMAHMVPAEDLLAQRARDLGLPHALQEIAALVTSAFSDRLPKVRLHASEADLQAYVRQCVDEEVVNDELVSSEMAMSNGDGIEEIYIPVDDFELSDLPPLGESLELDLEGHVTMGIDTERPYCGHTVDVRACLILTRTGKVSIAEPVCEVTSAHLDTDWGDDAEEEADVPRVSLAQALADELSLSLSEAEDLANAEAVAQTSSDGLVYGYVFDFSRHAPPEVAARLLAMRGSLQLEVPSWFFDRVAAEV